MLIGKVKRNKKKYVAELIGDKEHTISNKCINFSQYEKILYQDEERRIISAIPYEKEENELYVKLDNNEEINIKKLNKRKVDINDGDYCYFIFMEGSEGLLEYRGHCPKSLIPLLEEYFTENEKERKETLREIIYDQNTVKERKLSLDSKLQERGRVLSDSEG